MTEEEAKTKWCPMSLYLHNTDSMGNRWKQEPLDGEPYALNPIACRCISSACMFWRWKNKRNPNWKPQRVMAYPQPHPEDAPAAYIASDTEGYCGLAGRP